MTWKEIFLFRSVLKLQIYGVYTGFANDEIFDVLYNLCDPGENGENIRYWHSSSTGQDTTVLTENDEYIETFPV